MIEFKSTTTPQSERILAHTLGYPKSWHVVRVVIDDENHDIKNQSFQDTIYAGDPEISDCYFNHTAAMDAAMRWIEGESTKFDDEGGQLLPMEEDYLDYLEEGDEVEVYYEKDRKWYHATIIEVLQYRDDVRFTVQYTYDESTQTNVCLERIRETPANKKKKNQNFKKRKAVIDYEDDDEIDDEEDVKEVITPPPSKKTKTTPSKQAKSKSTPKQKKSKKSNEGNDTMPIEDGDPPWRTTGHKFLGRIVEYTFPDGVVGRGTCRGWISDTDVDKDNNPGFVSEKTNKPACLFHVVMELDCPVASQDFEEYEMEEYLIDEE